MTRFVLFFLALLMGLSQASAQLHPSLRGVVEHADYVAAETRINVRGWVASADGGSRPAFLAQIRGQSLQPNKISWIQRADLTPDNPALNGREGIGFSFHVTLPEALKSGTHALRVELISPDGVTVDLPNLAGNPETTLRVEGVLTRHLWLALVVVLALLLIQFFAARVRRGGVSRWLEAYGVWAIGGVFVVLVMAGVTGSSFGVMLREPHGLSFLDAKADEGRLFRLRGIRGDEGRVLIPNVLAQLHHDPKMPVVNHHLGENGQNMGVIGMTGVPVSQWAAWARPATWGYFFLPLRQAMAWQWQLPFWGCLLALWGMLNLLRPERRGLNLALSWVFCIAPYAAAWSNWPLYAALFPALAFLSAGRLLTTPSAGKTACWGLVLGWSLACWVLVLYPPWLVISGSALGLLAIGWGIDQRARLRMGREQGTALLLAGVVASLLLISWWSDTKDAVALIQATEYPGARGLMTGGDVSWWWHLRGYHNAETVASVAGASTNQSEVSSYFYLPLLWGALAIMNWRKAAGRHFALAGCFLFVACYWLFSFIGVPEWVAKYTLWGHVPTGRMELGMGIVGVVFLALLAESASSEVRAKPIFMPALVALASASLIALVISFTPDALLPTNDWVFTVTMAGLGGFACWWILRGRVGSGVAVLATAHLVATLHFNPIVRAPASVELADGNRPYVTTSGEDERLLETLVIGGGSAGPMALAAVGVPVINGVFYYPDAEFWRRLGLPEAEWKTVNRYQHLVFDLAENLDAPLHFVVSSPILDQVVVHVDPVHFDFTRTGAERVAALGESGEGLKKNPHLIWLGQYEDFQWFSVKRSGDTL